MVRNMIKRILPVGLFTFLSCVATAQFDTSFIEKNLLRCADSLTVGFKTKNWEQFTRYSYPAMVASLGGTAAFSNYISQMFSQVPASAWKKYEPGKVLQLIKSGRDYQAIIELKTVLDWEGNLIRSTSHLVGSSWDGGQFWTFFDSQGEERAARQIMPELDPQLRIPKREELKEPVNKTGGKGGR
jgi:hypothetical protein